ncbi:MAG: VanZ family protein [Candidatus Schekmanbacteria bacterium]|nr:VanZ family protein [Candidatus Schekmanbacteria bacterium]
MKDKIRKATFYSFWQLAGFSLIIFITIPYFPVLWKSLTASQQHLAVNFLYSGAGGTGLYLIYCIFRLGEQKYLRLLMLAFLSYFYALMFTSLSQFPAEKFHLIEYGILTFLAYRYFEIKSNTQNTQMAFLKSLSLVSCISIGDEFAQWISPNRVGTIEDIIVNIKSSLLALAGIALIMPVNKLRKRPARKDIVELTYYFVVLILFITAFITLVHEFGYEIRDRNYYFYSSFPSEKLQELAVYVKDNKKDFSNLDILKALRGEKSDNMNGGQKQLYKFVREASFHIYERDNAVEKKRYDKAINESAIIDKYYYPVYAVVKSRLRMEKPMPISGASDSEIYKSPVKSDLIYQITKKHFYVGSACLIVFLFMANVYLRRQL